MVRVELDNGTVTESPRFDIIHRAKGLHETLGSGVFGTDEYVLHCIEELLQAASDACEMETGTPYKSKSLKLLLQTREADL